MHVRRLTLEGFRNHPTLTIAPSRGLVALVGANGAGKTNILEALSLLSPGRGLRGAAIETMIAHGVERGIVAAQIADDAEALPPIELGTALDRAEPGRRRVRVNGADQAAARLGDWLAVSWLTPAMDRLFVESAGGRRRWLDRLTLALAPDHARHANRYEAAMRARNRLLADRGAGADPAWLAALEAQMGEHGAAIAAARSDSVAALELALSAREDDQFPAPTLALVGADRAPALHWTREDLALALRESRGSDARAGRTLVGPHRDDMLVRHRARDIPAELCSTGEQKALLISLTLAHAGRVAAARREPPLLLLDEVAAHLDPDRRAALYQRLQQLGAQCWLTGTDLSLFETTTPIEGWRVEAGAATPIA